MKKLRLYVYFSIAGGDIYSSQNKYKETQIFAYFLNVPNT